MSATEEHGGTTTNVCDLGPRCLCGRLVGEDEWICEPCERTGMARIAEEVELRRRMERYARAKAREIFGQAPHGTPPRWVRYP